MHVVVMESLEEYLAGTLGPADRRSVEAHLDACPSCREEVRGMEDVSHLMESLRPAEVFEPVPGFSAAVIQRVGAGQRAALPTFASLFSLDLAFGRRVVLASLLTLAVLGGYLFSRETDYGVSLSPEALLAQQESPEFTSGQPQDKMLVTLTAYDRR